MLIELRRRLRHGHRGWCQHLRLGRRHAKRRDERSEKRSWVWRKHRRANAGERLGRWSHDGWSDKGWGDAKHRVASEIGVDHYGLDHGRGGGIRPRLR